MRFVSTVQAQNKAYLGDGVNTHIIMEVEL